MYTLGNYRYLLIFGGKIFLADIGKCLAHLELVQMPWVGGRSFPPTPPLWPSITILSLQGRKLIWIEIWCPLAVQKLPNPTTWSCIPGGAKFWWHKTSPSISCSSDLLTEIQKLPWCVSSWQTFRLLPARRKACSRKQKAPKPQGA